MIKTVIFDMDGTLINSDALVEKIYRDLVTTYPPKVSFDSLDLNQVMALSYIEVMKILYQEVKQEYLDHIMMVHAREKKGQLTLFPYVEDMLSTLKDQGYYLGLVTSELREIALDELRILNILNYFDKVVAFDDVKHPKPHPEGILQILKKSQTSSYEAIMVGDQLSDAFAAKNAHVMSVFMGWDEQKLISMAKHYDDVASQAMDIVRLIEQRNRLILNFNEKGTLTIGQFTDFHWMNDDKDAKTRALVEHMIHQINPDFNVLTGDQTMGIHGVKLYQSLGQFMDETKIPYGFVFGNHDTEGGPYEALIQAILPSKELMFAQGPRHLGYSNYYIEIYDKQKISALIIFMDTHIDDMYWIGDQKVWGYGTINHDQMLWYERLIQRYPDISSYLFMHIPPYDIKHLDNGHVIGAYEESPSTPPIDTGFVSLLRSLGHTKGLFFGHDHYNDFLYQKDHLIMAYGRVSGYYVYGREGFTPGARSIIIDKAGYVETKIFMMNE